MQTREVKRPLSNLTVRLSRRGQNKGDVEKIKGGNKREIECKTKLAAKPVLLGGASSLPLGENEKAFGKEME